ncbi:hypothetical protein K490DRAFT_67176 [Saccharata proteae CBS 121410]|uniref:Uncharacterized protein n=1 Tax=Saccharata proteae CBS 121410 TaxID=1314787 RepID=A0A9P4LYE5_9PEZI|nr:hypothetical protein K490DRAFT_67176 [Saccharata proteae CBS 121410]
MDNLTSSDQTPSPLNIIFSCHVCQASISEIYDAGASSSDFHDGRPDTGDRRVTSLWLTECMHLVCGKHLEGGGAPFHPEGKRPEAPCPVCVLESKDVRPRRLFAVRGWKEGSYDDAIPAQLFLTPPIKLDGPGPEMEALQFQYLSLVRYGISQAKSQQQLVHAKREAESRAAEAAVGHKKLKQENQDLKAKIAELEKGQVDVVKWKQRMPQITHYLTMWPELIA